MSWRPVAQEPAPVPAWIERRIEDVRQRRARFGGAGPGMEDRHLIVAHLLRTERPPAPSVQMDLFA